MTMTIDLPCEIVGKVRSETLFRGLKLDANFLEKIDRLRFGLFARKC